MRSAVAAWIVLAAVPAGIAAGQTTPRIGGAQTSNTRVADPATVPSTTDASGAAHVVLKPNAAVKTHAKTAGKTAATISRDSSKPMNDVLPTDPMHPVELSNIGLKPLVLHRQPCVMNSARDAIHTRGPVVVDVQLDLNGNIDGMDYIGAPDLGEACMAAVREWKFAPYTFHGQPWRVSSWVRFEFATPQQRSADAK